MWHFSTVIFRLWDNFLLWHFDHVTFFTVTFRLWQFSTVTLRPCDFFYCDIPTLWHFDTVTFRLKVDGLFVHPKKWTVCHTVTFWPTVILANPSLWHFVHFWFWFFSSIPCLSYSWFWQMTFLWHYPLNFFASTYRFRRPRSDRGCLFNYFSNPTAHLEATVTFSNFPVMILTIVTFCPPLVKQAERLPVGPRWPVTKCHISFQSKSWRPVTIQVKKKVDVLLQWQNVLLSGGGGGL